jgi:hypothetical protein
MTIDEQIAQREEDLERSKRVLDSQRRAVEQVDLELRELRETAALREKQDKKTPGQQAAESIFRIANGWLTMERADQPGTPKVVCIVPSGLMGVESPQYLLPLMRASLAHVIDVTRRSTLISEAHGTLDLLREARREITRSAITVFTQEDIAARLLTLIEAVRDRTRE